MAQWDQKRYEASSAKLSKHEPRFGPGFCTAAEAFNDAHEMKEGRERRKHR